MIWTDDDKKALLAFKEVADSDDVRLKECVKDALLNNRYIVHALNNKELEEDEDFDPSDLYGVNILPYYMISPTQTNVKNFICYETSFDEEARYNNVIKYQQIVFTVLCEHKNIIDEETGINRHDLLAALILDQFNWTNIFGLQFHCVSDKASIVDTSYACRTIVLEGQVPNALTKSNYKNLTPLSNVRQSTRVVNSSETYGNLNPSK